VASERVAPPHKRLGPARVVTCLLWFLLGMLAGCVALGVLGTVWLACQFFKINR
jgi:LPS O-antigen subunit length determinant protein (WzzB/FepE family)